MQTFTEMKSERRRSIVWNYFRKSPDNKYVKCLLCSKIMRYFRNTTNLRLHLSRLHFEQVQNTDLTVDNDTEEVTVCNLETLEPLPVTFEIISSDSPGSSQAVVTDIETHREKQDNTRIRSFVWNYFTKTTDNEFVICSLCNKSLKFSHNTSNLRQHLKSRHSIESQETEAVVESEIAVKYIAESEVSEEPQSIAYEISETQVKVNNQAEESKIFLKMKSSSKISFVWNYFHKSSDGKFVTCSLCDRVLRYFRNTTNLRAHLKRLHSNEFQSECLAEENSQEHEISNHNKLEIARGATYTKLKPKRSIVWNYFKKDLDRNCAVCILCRKGFKVSNTTNLKDHLNRVHPNCVRRSKLPVIKTETTDFPAPKRMRLESYNRTILSDQKIKEINNSMIAMLAASYQSFSLIESPGFLEYSRKLQPLYTPPSKEQLLSTTLPEFYSTSVSELKMMLELVESVSISIDAWTTNASKSYFTITSHFIYEDKLYDNVIATREVFDIDCMENILSVLLPVFNEWRISDKIVAVVSNDVNHISKCMNIFPRPHQSCVAQMLNTAISDALIADEDLLKLLDKCKALVDYFKHTALVSEKLENIQQQMQLPLLKVKVDRGTWYSRYFMIKRLLEIRDPVCVTLTDLSRVPQFLDTSEWNDLSDCFSLLEPFELIVTELLYEKYPTMSLIIPLIRGLQYSLKSQAVQTEIGRLFKERLLSLTDYYLYSLESNKIASKATFLDPRFKTLAFGNEDTVEYVRKCIAEELLQIMNTNNTSNSESSAQNESKENSFIWAYFDTKIAQKKSSVTPFTTAMSMINQYLEMSNLERSRNWLEFWNDQKSIFPELYQLAMKYLCVPATAVPPERLFSRHGRLSDTFRNCLPSKCLEPIIFLNSYLALLGVQFVITLVMVSIIQKVGPHYSLARWLLCSTGLIRYLYPTDTELRQLANVPKEKWKPKKNPKIQENGKNKADTFHVPRSLDIHLETAKVSPLDVIHLRYYVEYQWLLDFSLYSFFVYLATEIYQSYFPEKSEVNLSMMWCTLVIIFALKILLSLTVQYFTGEESVGERSTCIVTGFVYLLVSMMVLIVDENTLELGLENAYISFNESASAFLSRQGLDTSGLTSKIVLKFSLAVFCGILGALFTFPGLRIAKMHWDLLKYFRENKIMQLLLNLSFALPFLLVILWIKPVSRNYLTVRKFSGMSEPLLEPHTFEAVRLVAVIVTMVIKLLLTPWYLQAYLDMAYHRIEEQKKEAGRITNIDLQKRIAAVFYYLCVATLQYVVPIIICLYITFMYKTLGGYTWNGMLIDDESCAVDSAPDISDADESSKSIIKSAQEFHMAVENLKSVFTATVFRGLFGFGIWWCCFLYFATTSTGMVYQSYFTRS